MHSRRVPEYLRAFIDQVRRVAPSRLVPIGADSSRPAKPWPGDRRELRFERCHDVMEDGPCRPPDDPLLALLAGGHPVYAALAITSMLTKSAVYDETAHFPAGYTYLTLRDFRMNPEHPPLVKELAALPLLLLDVRMRERSRRLGPGSAMGVRPPLPLSMERCDEDRSGACPSRFQENPAAEQRVIMASGSSAGVPSRCCLTNQPRSSTSSRDDYVAVTT